MTTVFENLTAHLGVDVGNDAIKKLTEYKDAIGQVIDKVTGLIGLGAGSYAGINLFSNFIGDAIEIGRVSDATGIAVEKLQAWKNAIESTGESGNAFIDTVRRMSDNLWKMRNTGDFDTGLQAIQNRLGIDLGAYGEVREATDILLDISSKWELLSAQEQNLIGKAFGLDEGTIRLLGRERGEIERLVEQHRKHGETMSKAKTIAVGVNEAYHSLRLEWKSISDELMLRLSPYIGDLLVGLKELSIWVFDNKPLFYGFLIGLSAWLLYVAASWMIAFSPVLAVIGLLAALGAALYILVDDYLVWKNGGISAFGDFWVKVDPIIQSVKSALLDLKDLIILFWNDPKAGWEKAKQWFDNWWNEWDPTKTDNFKNLFTNVGETIWNLIKSGILKGYEAVKGFLTTLVVGLFGKSEEVEAEGLGAKIVRAIRNGFEAAWEAIKEWFFEWWEDWDPTKSDRFGKIGEAIGGLIGEGIRLAFETTADILTSIIIGLFGDDAQVAADGVGAKIAKAIGNGLKTVLTEILPDIIRGVIVGIWNGLFNDNVTIDRKTGMLVNPDDERDVYKVQKAHERIEAGESVSEALENIMRDEKDFQYRLEMITGALANMGGYMGDNGMYYVGREYEKSVSNWIATTNIGTIEVNAPGADADKIAVRIQQTLKENDATRSNAYQADGGLTQ